MMKTLVIYDSYFGNTERIARSIGNALGRSEDVGILRVVDVKAEQLAGLKLLIVGSPTRCFSATGRIKKFLKSIPKNGLKDVKVAVFDTRITEEEIESSPSILRFMVNKFGYAAKPIAEKLEKKGGQLIAAPEGFFVHGTEGPLQEGEIERASAWAKQILTKQ